MTEWLLLLLSIGLVLACGGFVAAEFALVTVDRSTVERAAERGDRGADGTLAALRSLSTQLSAAQLGITITNLAIGFLAEPAIARLIDLPLAALGVPEDAITPVALTIALSLSTILTMVLGELVPKNLAIARPLETARAVQGFQRGFTTSMAYPIRWLNGSANVVVGWFGVEPQEELRSARGPEELGLLVRRSAQQGVLDRPTADLLERSIAFGRRVAGDIMTSRVRMASIDVGEPVVRVIELARDTGHSRFPVVRGSADDIVGVVHVKHAVAVPVEDRATVGVGEIAVAAVTAPDSLALDPLLDLLRREGLQMAVVVDEYGGTAGVVTLEDVVEEIVGDIADEHDQPGSRASQRDDGSWLLAGLLRPDEVADLTGVSLPEDRDYDTIAGLILDVLGKIPAPGDTVTIELPAPSDDLKDERRDAPAVPRFAVLTVERLDGRRVDRVALSVTEEPPGSEVGR